MDLKGMTMRVFGRGIKVVVAVAVAALANGVANAQTFASFTQIDPNLNPMRFINDGTANSRYGTYDAGGSLISVPVNFSYTIANALGEGLVNDGGSITATMTFSSMVNGVATPVPFPVLQTFQDLRFIDIAFVVNDALDYPVQTANNAVLLRVRVNLTPINGFGPGNPNPNTNTDNGVTATMAGGTGNSSVGITGSESSSASNYVGYESEFLDFNQTFTNRNFSLSITDIVPTNLPNNGYRVGGNAPGNPDSSEYVRSFEASMTGLFASNPQPLVPEPASIAFLLPMVAAVGWGIRKRL